ncbi:DUF2975 domain-containing protein [Rhodococcus sp. BP-252]|uniref:ABC transporter n=1 Tax=Rhodococcoides kyotonense TaxID=398843 RepID=A0A177YKJ6_9NOCA|nr:MULTISPECIES: DUF2975 domain-containing protein [Rhodococcus]MBY6414776.1 DUF2975 domain-containing protein [Rhodococcus sp. BP-320]MBY6419680.1 DUF2975 domain-containing protein [Rhodococcus sp. BP-321]MBY6424657.1 DUF2975 domain-containing protein [Rhodococcus sp. BP-324]MBY6429654.1 DUF2975 domain-containing protein [Rhodococcus sp. BP-323]MBY6434624.1 DUF2975 domain-containing protein [Rhodococcus sp. BP-322]
MGRIVVAALRVVIALALAGSVFVQAVMVPLTWIDLDDAPASVRVPLVVIVVLGIVTLQIVAICVWRLLTLVRKGTVFSTRSFRFVDVIIGAVTAAAVLAFALAVVLAPGEAVPPGIVGLICGASLVIGGVALLVLVLRMLLSQAVARDTEATKLQSELDEVI